MRYLVIKKVCPHCNGEGWVIHPEWAEFNEHFKAALSHGVHLSYVRWFRERGYLSEAEIPEEEERCPVCKGSGVVQEEVPLEEDLEPSKGEPGPEAGYLP